MTTGRSLLPSMATPSPPTTALRAQAPAWLLISPPCSTTTLHPPYGRVHRVPRFTSVQESQAAPPITLWPRLPVLTRMTLVARRLPLHLPDQLSQGAPTQSRPMTAAHCMSP